MFKMLAKTLLCAKDARNNDVRDIDFFTKKKLNKNNKELLLLMIVSRVW